MVDVVPYKTWYSSGLGQHKDTVKLHKVFRCANQGPIYFVINEKERNRNEKFIIWSVTIVWRLMKFR